MESKVFISHANADRAKAVQVCDFLETQGLPCWIAPRNISYGEDWSKAIMEGIREAKVMILIFTSSANDSPHVLREVQIALENGVKLIPMRMENIKPSDGLGYFIATPQWLEAYAEPLEKYLQALADTINRLVQPIPGKNTKLPPISPEQRELADSKWKKVQPRLIISTMGVVLAIIITLIYTAKDIGTRSVQSAFLNIAFLSLNIILIIFLFISLSDDKKIYKKIKIINLSLFIFTTIFFGMNYAAGVLLSDYGTIICLVVYSIILILYRKDH
jgi:hypothetical protein